jgi:hypothetical protein
MPQRLGIELALLFQTRWFEWYFMLRIAIDRSRQGDPVAVIALGGIRRFIGASVQHLEFREVGNLAHRHPDTRGRTPIHIGQTR